MSMSMMIIIIIIMMMMMLMMIIIIMMMMNDEIRELSSIARKLRLGGCSLPCHLNSVILFPQVLFWKKNKKIFVLPRSYR